MSKSRAAFCALLCTLLVTPLYAEQKKKDAPKAAAPMIRYFNISLLSELSDESFLKETRQGTRLVSAELDVCHLIADTPNQRDRFVVPLQVSGNRLTGTTQSQEKKAQVAVNLTRKVSGNNYTFEGTITLAGQAEEVSSADNTEMSENDYAEAMRDEPIEEKPEDFTELSPQGLAVKVERAAVVGLVNSLRDQNVRLWLTSIEPSCSLLRTGFYVLRLEVDPERTPALMARLKTAPGVKAVGYAAGSDSIDRAIRFGAARWLERGRLNRAKFATAIGDGMAKAFSAAISSSTWNDTTGRLTVVAKRPSETVPQLNLTESLSIEVLVSPEKLGSNENLVAWVSAITLDVADESSGPKLVLNTTPPAESPPPYPSGAEAMLDDIAKELGGKTWDGEKKQWNP